MGTHHLASFLVGLVIVALLILLWSAAERMGLSKATIRLWHNGDRAPDLEQLLRLVYATQRPLDPDLHERIFGRDDPPLKAERRVSA